MKVFILLLVAELTYAVFGGAACLAALCLTVLAMAAYEIRRAPTLDDDGAEADD